MVQLRRIFLADPGGGSPGRIYYNDPAAKLDRPGNSIVTLPDLVYLRSVAIYSRHPIAPYFYQLAGHS